MQRCVKGVVGGEPQVNALVVKEAWKVPSFLNQFEVPEISLDDDISDCRSCQFMTVGS